MLVPLYGFLEGDCLGLVVLVHDQDRVSDIVEKVQQAASVRVAPRLRMRVEHDGRLLTPEMTIAQAGLAPLDRVDVVDDER
jgi:hypothetical protein